MSNEEPAITSDAFARYAGNSEAFSREEQAAVRRKRVCVIGCGGLGGYVCQGLARFGVGALTLVDDDVFTTGNLNRQLFATEKTLGLPKVAVCREQLAVINSEVEVTAHRERLAADNAARLLGGCDLAVDCLDNPPARLAAAERCRAMGIPLVHGAVGGFAGQIANVFPGDTFLDHLYAANMGGVDNPGGNPVFTVELVAALQTNEALKILAGKPHILRNSLLYIDLLRNVFEVFRF